MPSFDHFDDDDQYPRPNRRSDDDVQKFREQLRNGEKDINSTEALEEIIQFYFEHEQFEEALSFTERLLSFEPYSSDAWQRKGIILNNLVRHDEALECFEQALALNPADADIFVSRGVALDNLNRVDEALGSLERALELEPMHEEALFLKGVALEKQDKFEDALTCFRRILTVN